jgi:ribosome biogenesis GTPase / thiamine phosphate phosphatase
MNIQEIQASRDSDDRGRHTTTRRDLLLRKTGGCLIDTPGMRELHLWVEDDSDLSGYFDDITALAGQCRFRDCQHDLEPGCAIYEALEKDELDWGRYSNYCKLKREQAWLERKVNLRAKQAEKRHRKGVTRAFNKRIKAKGFED